jgi:uncharacterized protein YraI
LTGAKIDGWVPFFVYKNDPHPILFVEDNFLENKGTYFALSPSNTRTSALNNDTPQVQFTSPHTNIRSGPGTQFQILETANQGDAMQITGRNQNSTWWQICCVEGLAGWVANSVVTTKGNLNTVPIVKDAPLPNPSTQLQSPPTNLSLVADSITDYPNNNINRKWWHLWSDGRFNFQWQDMRDDPKDCARPPNSFPAFICADRAGTDANSDIALLWKAPQGADYIIEWQASTTKGQGNVFLYRHLQEIYSTGPGPTLPNSVKIDNVESWEQFFFVIRTDGSPYETTIHVRVYQR